MRGTDPPMTLSIPVRLTTAVKGEDGRPDVRMFDVHAVNEFIDSQMDQLEPGETIAAIVHADLSGAHISVVGKLPDLVGGAAKWTVYSSKPYHGSWRFGAALRWSR